MKKTAFVLVILIFALLSAKVYSDSVMEDITSNLVRLHIIANSDSVTDQHIKLCVRDRLTGFEQARGGKVSIAAELEKAANECLEYMGAPYRARAYYGRYGFPEKTYENITLPSGSYNALRLVLGAGEGKNWWCVLSPPMCFTKNALGTESEEALSTRLDRESIKVIKAQRGKINVKFKLVELFSGH